MRTVTRRTTDGFTYSAFYFSLTFPPKMSFQGFPSATSGKELVCQCRRHKKLRFNPWVGKIPWRRKRQPTPVFLPGEWTEESCGLQSMGSHRVRHNLSDLACTWPFRIISKTYCCGLNTCVPLNSCQKPIFQGDGNRR